MPQAARSRRPLGRHGCAHLKRYARSARTVRHPKSHLLTLPAGTVKCAQIICALLTAQIYALRRVAHAHSPEACHI